MPNLHFQPIKTVVITNITAIIPVSGSVHNGSPGTWIKYTSAENLEFIRSAYRFKTQYAFEYFEHDYPEIEPSEYADSADDSYEPLWYG